MLNLGQAGEDTDERLNVGGGMEDCGILSGQEVIHLLTAVWRDEVVSLASRSCEWFVDERHVISELIDEWREGSVSSVRHVEVECLHMVTKSV